MPRGVGITLDAAHAGGADPDVDVAQSICRRRSNLSVEVNDGDLSAPIATLIHGCPQSTHTRQRCPRLSCTNSALTAQQLPRKAQVVQTQISKWRSPSAASPGIRGGQQFLAQGFGLKHDDGSCLLAARKNGPSFRAGMAQVVGRYGSSFKAAGNEGVN